MPELGGPALPVGRTDSDDLMRTIVASVHEGLVVYDRELRYQLWNRYMEELSGFPASAVLGRRAPDLFPHVREQGVDRLLARALTGETVQVPEVRYVQPHTGEVKWYVASYAPHRNGRGEIVGVLASIRETTDRREMERRLLHDALHDGLTGLANRAVFMDRLQGALERTRRHPDRPCAVLYLDLDRFKVINDSLGHGAGDRTLKALAGRLPRCVRTEDTVARLGGDEFAFLLQEVEGMADALRASARILREVARPIPLATQEVFTTGSIGITLADARYHKAEEVLRDADIAMYRAKGAGGARHQIFDPSMHERAVALMRMESDLRRALQRDELELHYQPIFSLATGRVVGVEALSRWGHPERGPVRPEEFVPLAEDTGLILPLGRWTLRNACRQARQWRRGRGSEPLAVSVNLSARHFAHEALPGEVATALAEAGLEGEALTVEITEHSLVDDTGRAAAVVGALKKLGVSIHIDDFGTGYSSLSCLHRFPIDGLKIGPEFVAGLGRHGEPEEIVRTVILLARRLGMDVVAEGVETVEQLEHLRALQCGYAQGFLLAAPVPASAVDPLL